MVKIVSHAENNHAEMGAPREISYETPVPNSLFPSIAKTAGVSQVSTTIYAIVQFDVKKIMEPDFDTPRSIADLANERRQFLASVETDYVDIDLPYDH